MSWNEDWKKKPRGCWSRFHRTNKPLITATLFLLPSVLGGGGGEGTVWIFCPSSMWKCHAPTMQCINLFPSVVFNQGITQITIEMEINFYIRYSRIWVVHETSYKRTKKKKTLFSWLKFLYYWVETAKVAALLAAFVCILKDFGSMDHSWMSFCC